MRSTLAMMFAHYTMSCHAVTFLLLFLCLTSVGVQPGSAVGRSVRCPRLCHCDWTQEFSIHCIGQQTAMLTSVPSPLPNNVTNLEFSFNTIQDLKARDFPEILTLRRLVFHDCGLQTLDPRTFANLRNLVELSLDHNRLRLIPSGAFYGLVKLRSLSLNNNDLIKLDGWTFAGLSLSHLNLHDNPSLAIVSEDVFANASVETLSLDRCPIRQVPARMFRPLGSSLRVLHWSHSQGLVLPTACLSGLRLESLFLTFNALGDGNFLLDDIRASHIFLGSNQIQSLDLSHYPSLSHTETLALNDNKMKDLFYSDNSLQLPRLKELDVSNNNLKDLSVDLLGALPNLTTLDVSRNDLGHFAPSLRPVFHRLTYLDVSGNDIACNCSMEWYRQWLHSVDPAKVIVNGQVCRMDSFSNKTQPCEGPHIVQLADTSDDVAFSFVCTARGLPLPSLTWRFNVTQSNLGSHRQEVVSSIIDSSSSANTSKLVIVKSSIKIRRCLAVECFANNSMGVMHQKLRHCLKVDTSSFVGDDVMTSNQNLAPVVALAVVVSLTFVSVTVLSKCARGLYVRWKERHEHRERSHVSQRSLIATHVEEEDLTHNFSDDTDV